MVSYFLFLVESVFSFFFFLNLTFFLVESAVSLFFSKNLSFINSHLRSSVADLFLFQLGGYSNGHGYSTRNCFVWNAINERHEDIGIHLTHPHYIGDFTRLPADAKILSTCRLDGN